ncbi:MAG: hypothetical protein JWO06_3557 [Bacteroidota bacterium]|nr:hypothetical protein [Bacteroidota bacterium]
MCSSYNSLKICLFCIWLVSSGFHFAPIVMRTSVSDYRDKGLDVSWDQSGSDRIAYSSKGPDGYYDIHIANPDGLEDSCLTCNHPALPNKHICCPHWHPSGKWLMMVVERASHPGSSFEALPGLGAYSDVWVISADGKKAYKILDIPDGKEHGVIDPRFSPDGKKIVWTERTTAPDFWKPRQMAGFWTIKTADFAFGKDDVPVLSNIKIVQPGETAFYECYGFSPDGQRLIFCSAMNTVSFWNENIYTMDTSGKNVVQLTEKNYNEHGFYSPGGKQIVWMTNAKSRKGGTDWWIMNFDGSDKKQLTYFNERHNPQSAKKAVWAGLGSFSPGGDRFIGGVQLSLLTQEGKIMMVKLLP